MAEITKLTLVGDWRVVVQSRDAGWDQRVIVSNTAAGSQTLNGVVGVAPLDVYGNGQAPWELRIQHNDGQHGWQNSWLRPGARQISGSSITQVIESEDITTDTSDRDFNDLVIRLEKLGMVDQPARPFAVWPATMQMMPDGIFETSLGRYFMAVRVRNVWTETWPVDARVGLTQRCRASLAAGGITVIDHWSAADQAAVGQEVVGGRVRVGALEPWNSRLIYFKVDVTHAGVRKHNVEVEVLEPVAEDLDHLNRKARAQIFVSRTTYDAVQKVFVSTCDRGRMTVAVRELAVDYHTFKRAMGKARKILGSDGTNGSSVRRVSPLEPREGSRWCARAELERLRRELRAFLDGKDVDICAIWRRLQCCCAYGGFDGAGDHQDGNGDWSGRGGTGLEFFAFPTVVDYRIDYLPNFLGQYGPIPFDDPWWKLLLLIIAIILTLATAASAVADLANRSDDVVIGQLTRSRLEDTTDNLVDAAVVTLNGNRSLRTAVFSYLDAAAGEDNTTPVISLNGIIDTTGATLSNADILTRISRYAATPDDPDAINGVRVFKSGARTGVTFGRMTAVSSFTRDDHDGVSRSFVDQLYIVHDDPPGSAELTNSGDSGSLWLTADASRAIVALNHAGPKDPPHDHAWASRIEDVITELGIEFA